MNLDANGKNRSFECCEGSHVFFSNGNGDDFYSEWADLTIELQNKFMKLKQTVNNTVNAVHLELSQVLLPVAP